MSQKIRWLVAETERWTKAQIISAEQAGQIRDLFRQDLLPRDLLRESGRLLSELSGMPAVGRSCES